MDGTISLFNSFSHQFVIQFHYNVCNVSAKSRPKMCSFRSLFAFHFHQVFKCCLSAANGSIWQHIPCEWIWWFSLVNSKSYKWNLIKINVNKSQRLRKMFLICNSWNFVYLNNNREWSFSASRITLAAWFFKGPSHPIFSWTLIPCKMALLL